MSRKAEIISFSILIALTIFFSSYHLLESPSVWYDEGLYVQAAQNLADGHGVSFRFSPDEIGKISALTVGYPLIYPLASVFEVFGHNILAGRIMMVFWILLLAISAYFFIRKKSGAILALTVTALIVTFPPLYGNGKSILGEVPGLVFLILSLLFLQLEPKKFLNHILSGLFAGLCVATKPLFLLFLPGYVLVVLWKSYKKDISIKNTIVSIISILIPIILWLFIQFGSDISLKTVMSFYANPYGVSNIWQIIFENIINFFTEAGPLYLLILMVVWFSALIIKKYKKEKFDQIEIIAFIFSLLICLAYLRIVGWHRYIFPAQIVALLYFPSSLLVCGQLFGDKIKKISMIFASTVLIIWGIYGIFFNSWVAEFYLSHKTAFWINYFKDIPAEKSIFFYDSPEVAIFSKSDNYYQYLPLLAAGGPFGEYGLKDIRDGQVDQVIIRTDTYQDQKELLKKYHPVLEAYKYTILDKSI